MSDSSSAASTPLPAHHPAPTPSRMPTAYPGFAMPKEALPSITISSELDEWVRKAAEENRVQTALPKFFNPLFRRQGVVNKHALQALESVGRSLSQLAQEIERRDRVLEALAAHFTSYSEGVRQQQLGFAQHALQQGTQIQEQAQRLAELQQRVEAGETASAAASGSLRHEVQSLVDSLSQRFDTALAEQRDTLEKQYSGRLLEVERKLATLEERSSAALDVAQKASALETAFLAFKRANESDRSNADIREESLVSSLRAATAGYKDLATQCTTLRQNLFDLTEVCATLSRRQGAAETGLSASRLATEHLLPALKRHLEQLAGTAASPAQEEAIAADAVETVTAAQSAEADGFYAALEARFRGPRTIIRERQSHYLPLVEEARTRVEMFPPVPRATPGPHALDRLYAENGVLDLGSGRGEWLELLKEQGVAALGVELNQLFLQTSRQRNVEVVAANLVEFLAAAPADSAAVITGFHLIEHLPFPVLQDVIRQCFRVLRRGGTAIFETPNPGNILTSSLNFRLDPTHQHPIHPQLAQFLMESGGFSAVRLDFLHAYDASQHVGEPGNPLADRFNAYFYGPQDYAVIGVKP